MQMMELVEVIRILKMVYFLSHNVNSSQCLSVGEKKVILDRRNVSADAISISLSICQILKNSILFQEETRIVHIIWRKEK